MSSLPAVGPLKIVILGEGRVGKTSMLRQYVKHTFDDSEASTQSAAYLEKRITLRGKQVLLSLWDTAGQERFHALAPIYYRDADGALLVYDVTDVESFRRVAKWVEELGVMGTQCALGIVGNKMDLRSQVRVPTNEAEAYALSIHARHSLASAKLGQGVEETFSALVQDVLDFRPNAGLGAPGRQARGTMLVVDDTVPQRQRGCCGGPGS